MSDRVVLACECRCGLDLYGPGPWVPYLRSCNKCRGYVEEINIDHLLRLKRACLNWREAQKEHRPYFSECDAILDELKAGEATE